MNNQFDELAKGLAQSVTRRAALKEFGVGLAGMALVALGLTNRANATSPGPILRPCKSDKDCPPSMRCMHIKGPYKACVSR